MPVEVKTSALKNMFYAWYENAYLPPVIRTVMGMNIFECIQLDID